MRVIGIRVDGGPGIGFGHIMRCLSIAKEFVRLGHKVYFICRYLEAVNRIRFDGFNVIRLNSKYTMDFLISCKDKEELYRNEAAEIAEILKECSIEALIIDTYNVSKDYFLELKRNVRVLCYIDDLNKFSYPVDIIVNGNITGKRLNYIKYFEDEVLLLGPEYNLIRDEFKGIPKRTIFKDVRKIMITTGATDPYNTSLFVLQVLLGKCKMGSIGFNIVVGDCFQNKDLLYKVARENSNVTLHENVKKISEIMLSSDIAISAAGSTLYELCACGTPTLSIILADNQEGIAEAMQQEGYIDTLGWYNTVNSDMLIDKVLNLACNYEKRQRLSRRMQELVDGLGTSRVVNCILDILSCNQLYYPGRD